MNDTPDLSTDPATKRILDALTRSARQARRIAAQTQTEIVVMREGKLVKERVPLDVLRSEDN